MSRYRFVKPETVRLDLSDGDWIEVKKELTAGEARAISRSSVRAVTDVQTGKTVTEEDLDQLSLLNTYLTNWSFVDAAGKQSKYSLDALRALDQDSYVEIVNALAAHIRGVREAQQSDPTVPAPVATSTSVAGWKSPIQT